MELRQLRLKQSLNSSEFQVFYDMAFIWSKSRSRFHSRTRSFKTERVNCAVDESDSHLSYLNCYFELLVFVSASLQESVEGLNLQFTIIIPRVVSLAITAIAVAVER